MLLARNLWLGLGVVPVAFFAAAPFVVLDWQQALRDIAVENRASHLGADRLPGMANYLWYLQVPLPQGLGLLGVLAAALGIAAGLRVRWREQVVLATLPLLYLVLLGNANLRWARWAIPLLPFGALWAGWFLTQLGRRCQHAGHWRAVSAVLLVALLVQPLADAARYGYRQSQTDTRTLAKQWLEEHLPSGASIAAEMYTGFITRGDLRVGTLVTVADLSLDEYRAQGYDYLLVSESMWARFLAEPAKYPRQAAFYQALFSRAPPIVEFLPAADAWWAGRPGPTVRLYRVP